MTVQSERCIRTRRRRPHRPPNFLITPENVSTVRASTVFRGEGWLGVKMRDASVVRGIGVLPVFTGLIGLLLLLGAFAATWLREGR